MATQCEGQQKQKQYLFIFSKLLYSFLTQLRFDSAQGLMDSSTPNWDEMYDEDSLEENDTSIDDFNVFEECDVFDDRDDF